MAKSHSPFRHIQSSRSNCGRGYPKNRLRSSPLDDGNGTALNSLSLNEGFVLLLKDIGREEWPTAAHLPNPVAELKNRVLKQNSSAAGYGHFRRPSVRWRGEYRTGSDTACRTSYPRSRTDARGAGASSPCSDNQSSAGRRRVFRSLFPACARVHARPDLR